MKIIIVSDTHGRIENYEKLLKKEEQPDMLFHCGDIGRDEDYIPFITPCPLYMVAGNNDYSSDLSSEQYVYVENYKIMITHGHMYGVNYSTERLAAVAKTNGAQIVCYGHTHVPLLQEMDGVTIINPGSLSLPRQMGRIPTYAVLEIEEEKISVKICEMEK